MPLEQGRGEAVIGRNIETERAAGKPEQQAIAIAESEARRSGRDSQPGMAGAPNAGIPRGRSANDGWKGRTV